MSYFTVPYRIAATSVVGLLRSLRLGKVPEDAQEPHPGASAAVVPDGGATPILRALAVTGSPLRSVRRKARYGASAYPPGDCHISHRVGRVTPLERRNVLACVCLTGVASWLSCGDDGWHVMSAQMRNQFISRGDRQTLNQVNHPRAKRNPDRVVHHRSEVSLSDTRYQVSMYGYFLSVRFGGLGTRRNPCAIHRRVSAGSMTSSKPPPVPALTALAVS